VQLKHLFLGHIDIIYRLHSNLISIDNWKEIFMSPDVSFFPKEVLEEATLRGEIRGEEKAMEKAEREIKLMAKRMLAENIPRRTILSILCRDEKWLEEADSEDLSD
jgi:hypothetical protein